MNREQYDEIIETLRALPQDKKLEYLKSVIEGTDYDKNSWNGELINLYNKYTVLLGDKS